MHLDVFSEGQSVLHALDPRVKILGFVPLVFVIAFLDNAAAAFCYLVLGGIFVMIARTNVRALAARVAAVNVFVAFLWVTLPFNIPGRTIWAAGPFAFTAEGAGYTLLVTLKANAILLFTIAVIGTTDLFVLAHALFHLKFPRKLVYLSVFLYRYVGVIHGEYDRLMRTLKARLFAPATDLATLRTIAYMVGLLFINSYERSQRIYQAMTLRGFRGDFPMLRHFHYHTRDVVFGVLVAALVLMRFVLWT